MSKIIQGITAACMVAFAPLASSSAIATFELPDALEVNQFDGLPNVVVLDASTVASDGVTTFGDLAINDTFTGSVEFYFTITPTPDSITSSYNFFVLRDFDGGQDGVPGINARIGNEWDGTIWVAGSNGSRFNITDDDGATVPLVNDVAVSFEMVIDYVAGADDSARVRFGGQDEWTFLSDRDYTLNTITAQAGGGSGSSASFTDMSVVVIPEPATMAMVFGAVVLGLVILRRRMRNR